MASFSAVGKGVPSPMTADASAVWERVAWTLDAFGFRDDAETARPDGWAEVGPDLFIFRVTGTGTVKVRIDGGTRRGPKPTVLSVEFTEARP